MTPLPVPDDAHLEAARAALHEWSTIHGYEDSFPDDVLVMFFRAAVEQQGWQLRLRWRPGDGVYSGRWSFRGTAAEDLVYGRSLDEARLVGCAALIHTLFWPRTPQKTSPDDRITQPPPVPDANSSRTD